MLRFPIKDINSDFVNTIYFGPCIDNLHQVAQTELNQTIIDWRVLSRNLPSLGVPDMDGIYLSEKLSAHVGKYCFAFCSWHLF